MPDPDAQLSAVVDGFLGHASVERGLARNTVEAYARDLAAFTTFLEEVGVTNLADLYRKHVSGFVQALAGKGHRFQVVIVSDSQYLIRGMREWVPNWKARNWRRKTGAIENLELWQRLDRTAARHDVQWTWVRGHRGHVKNEYSNDLAVLAATEQRTSNGATASGFAEWFADKQMAGKYLTDDPDESFAALEHYLQAGKPLPLVAAE